MTASGLFRLYIGKLPSDVTKNDLQMLFESHDLSAPRDIVIKPAGYGFIELNDQTSFDKAIYTFNGYNFMGSEMQVEPSSASRRRRSNKIHIRNIPAHATKEDIEQLVRTFGQVQRCDIVSTNTDVSVTVTYENQDQAQQAVEQLKDYEYQGSLLKPDYHVYNRDNKARSSQNGNGGGRGGNNRNSNGGGNGRGSGYPLRILVPSDFVGAIIGKKGATIRKITTECKARVDVQGKGNSGLLEKVISIYGQPENCTKACKEIMDVMQTEAANTNRQEVPLKILADDRYCGRIIGKEGKIIKKLREDTDSKISVSNVQEMPTLYPDRVITIRGSQDNVSEAENAISGKLRECYEKEMNMPLPPGMMMPGGPMGGMGPMRGNGGMYGGGGMGGMQGGGHYGGGMQGGMDRMGGGNQGYYPQSGGGMYGSGGHGGHGGHGNHGGHGGNPMGGMPPVQMPQQPQQQPPRDEVMIMVPNSAVGALIGAGGSHIKQIIRDSNAYVNIEPKRDDETSNPAAERMVTIKGTQEAKWKASYIVFEKLQKEGFAGNDEMRLRTGLYVPKNMVGRVIGKKGTNVRELQRVSGAMVKVPEGQETQTDDIVVEIYGTFMQANMAQNRLRSFISQGMNQPPMGPGGDIRGPPGGGLGGPMANGRPPRR